MKRIEEKLRYLGVTYILVLFIGVIVYLFSDNTVLVKLGGVLIYALALIIAYYIGMLVCKIIERCNK
jgi:hypothetical protein